MSGLASLLDARAEELLRRWIERLRHGIASGGEAELELRNHVPILLRELAEALRAGEVTDRSDAAEEHGRQRYRLGFDLEALVREYGVLRNVICDLAEEEGRQVSLAELRIVADFVSNAVARGVTEHNEKRLADERAQAKELLMFKALVEASDDYIAVVDVARTVKYLNPAAWRTSGFASATEAMATPLEDTLTDSSRTGPGAEAYAETLAGRSWRGEIALVDRTTGHAVPLEAQTIPIRGAEGTVELLGTINRDIRARQQHEMERRELLEAARAARDDAEAERAKLESLFAQAPVGIAIQEGPEHTYTFANDAYRAIVNRQDIVGKPILDALPELRGQGFDKLFDEVKRSGKPFVAEAQPATLLREGKLETGWFSFIFAPKRDARGEIDGILQCAFEVTAQVEAHRQIELALKRQSEFEQQLIGIVSHDLRNPLNVISMAAELLRGDETLAPRSLQFVVRIKNATDRALRLVGDLLDFTKARLGGGIAVRAQPADFHRLVASVVDEVGAAHPDRTIALTHEGDGAGSWDPDRLGQAIQNLVTNALKHGSPDEAVTVTTRGDGDEVRLVVHNRGTPIPANKLGVLFEPFERAVAGGKSADRSIGLGLYIVRHVIDAHRGSIEVTSSAEAGTTFTVHLPREPSPERTPGASLPR